MTRIIIITIFVIAGAVSSAGCGGSDADPNGPIVAAFYPLAYAAERVAGGGERVVNLTPAGAEPHDFELTASDVRAVREARIVLYLKGFMPALDQALEERQGPSLDLLSVARDGQGKATAAPDPHIWLDPRLYGEVARAIARALGRGASAEEFVRELDTLDHEFAHGLARCKRREIVTSHEAFGYLAARYGLEQVSLSGIKPEVEPSAQALAHLVDKVRSTGATTVFFEPLVSSRVAETVAREAGVRTAVLDPIEGLSGDRGARHENYASVMRSDLATLEQALECR